MWWEAAWKVRFKVSVIIAQMLSMLPIIYAAGKFADPWPLPVKYYIYLPCLATCAPARRRLLPVMWVRHPSQHGAMSRVRKRNRDRETAAQRMTSKAKTEGSHSADLFRKPSEAAKSWRTILRARVVIQAGQ